MPFLLYIGTGFREVQNLGAHIQGDSERAQQQWAEAGMNLAGRTGNATRAGVITATTGTKEGAKEVTKQTAKQGSRETTTAARKQVTKKGMKKYPRIHSINKMGYYNNNYNP